MVTGGTINQVLIKNSSTDYDTSWVNYIPTGGTSSQYLVKTGSTNYATAWTGGTTPLYLSVNKNSAQSIPTSTETTIIDWDGSQVNNTPSAWNATTGTWTCPKAGTYDISWSPHKA